MELKLKLRTEHIWKKTEFYELKQYNAPTHGNKSKNNLPEYGICFGRLNLFRLRKKDPLSNIVSAAGSIVQ